jgi:hypothetical protein
MIAREQMFDPLLHAAPGLLSAWNEFHADWPDQEDGPLDYLAISYFARHLVQKLENGDIADLPAVFAVVERWHVEGDVYVKEAATVGMLEELQNSSYYTSKSPEDFLPWLHPQSLRWWRKVEAFWRDGTLLRDD